MPDLETAAKTSVEPGREGEERRKGAKDRRTAKVDRRNPERVADEIAPRRHPNLKGRRESDQ